MRINNAWRVGLLLILTYRVSASGPEEANAVRGRSGSRHLSATAMGEQDPNYEGQLVVGIELPGVSEKDRDHMIQLVDQKVGQPLNRQNVRASIRALYATGRFADIQVEVTPSGNGIRLSFISVPNYFVGKVEVEAGGIVRPTDNQTLNAAKFQLGELYTLEKLNRALENVRRLMEENGYYRARVTAESASNQANQQVDLLLHITAGEAARVGRVQVQIQGASGKLEDRPGSVAGLETGDRITASNLRDSLQRLRKTYQKQNRVLAQVVVSEQKYHSETNTVDFTFRLDPGPVVSIYAQGFRISRAVLKKEVPIYEENAVDDDLLNEGKRNLQDYLQARGHFDATVEVQKESGPDTLRVVYRIEPGPVHRVESVQLTGNKYFDQEALEPLLQVQAATRFVSHGRYSGALVRADVARMQDLYRSNGFRQVHIESKVDDNYHGSDNHLAVQYQIAEGPQTLVGAAQVTGNSKIPQVELPALETASGQPYSEQNLASDRQRILNYYFNHGYSNATLEIATQPGQAGRMDVTYRIEEGSQFLVNQVMVSGLEHTRPYIVDRELQIAHGEPLSEEALVETQTRLYNVGVFSQVDVAVQNPAGSDPFKNVLVQAEEAKRYTFTYGVGLEFQTGQPAGSSSPQGRTGVSPRVSFDMTRLNVGGRNRTASFQSHVGRLQQRGLASYQVPRLFDAEKFRLIFSAIYDNSLDVSTFTSQRLEGRVELNQEIGKVSPIFNRTTTSMAYRFEFRRVKASNFASSFSTSLIPLLSLPARVGGPGFTFVMDKRDSPLESTRGSYTTIDGFGATSQFGSEADFGRILAQNSTYRAFGGKGRQGHQFVFARSTSLGVEQPFGATRVLPPGACPTTIQNSCSGISVIPLPELFFAGGGNSHRGFGLNQAGPRDPSSGFPLGGTALFVNNLELRFPPVTLPYLGEGFGLAVFHDMGNVFTAGHDALKGLTRWHESNPARCLNPDGTPIASCFSRFNGSGFDYTSHAVGVGLRYRTPIGPLRFDFGYNLNPTAYLQGVPNPINGKPQNIYVPKSLRHFNVFFSIGQPF